VVLDDDGDFRIMIAKLRAIVEVSGAANDNTVVGDEQLVS
jgi:hypothetical protein